MSVDALISEVFDNIADGEPMVLPEHAQISENVNLASTDDETAEYMKRFEAVEARNKTMRGIVTKLDSQPDQDSRLTVIFNYVNEQQKINEEMYDLLVSMNNFFSPK